MNPTFMKQQLQQLLDSSTNKTIALTQDVTLEYAYHEFRFYCRDCKFILSQLHLERGIWHILPVTLHDFDKLAIALVHSAIEDAFGADVQRGLELEKAIA
jgi:hypothetical protein